MGKKKRLLGNMNIRSKIIIPTIIILILSNLIFIFTSTYKMEDLAKSNAKVALHQLSDSIFLNLRTAIKTGNNKIIREAEETNRNNIKGLESLIISGSFDVIALFPSSSEYTKDPETLKVFSNKKEIVLEEKSSELQEAWEKQVLKKISSFFFLLSQKYPLQSKVTIIIWEF